jgi:hypothetical protein
LVFFSLALAAAKKSAAIAHTFRYPVAVFGDKKSPEETSGDPFSFRS